MDDGDPDGVFISVPSPILNECIAVIQTDRQQIDKHPILLTRLAWQEPALLGRNHNNNSTTIVQPKG